VGTTVAVAGASGYAGGEVLRLLSAHPSFDIGPVTAGSSAGRRVGQLLPHLPDLADRVIEQTTPALLATADLVFLALPPGASGPLAAALPADVPIVDLGADHRLADPSAYADYYVGDYQGAWTYGLPELPGQRAAIAASSKVASTGCHAVAAILALAPLIAAGLADPDDIVVTSVTGTSGAGKKTEPHLLGAEVMGDLSPYSVGAHRHVPEILQATGARNLTFTPVLAPLPRGILLTASARPGRPELTTESVREALAAAYSDEPFVHLLGAGQWPRTKATFGSNACHLQAAVDRDSGRITVCAAIDNLGKGTAGQAIQCANLMLGIAETTGLTTSGVAP
jgi:N-acetyl-gamma-glutamyl-phosphate reductase